MSTGTTINCDVFVNPVTLNYIAFCEARHALSASEWAIICERAAKYGLEATQVKKNSRRFLLVRYFEKALRTKAAETFKDAVLGSLEGHDYRYGRFFDKQKELPDWQRELVS